MGMISLDPYMLERSGKSWSIFKLSRSGAYMELVHGLSEDQARTLFEELMAAARR